VREVLASVTTRAARPDRGHDDVCLAGDAFSQASIARVTAHGPGRSLTEPIAAIADWAEVNVGRITAAQAAYDAIPGAL
jgi:hypothetical protein